MTYYYTQEERTSALLYMLTKKLRFSNGEAQIAISSSALPSWQGKKTGPLFL
jgi:hypothetical protein